MRIGKFVKITLLLGTLTLNEACDSKSPSTPNPATQPQSGTAATMRDVRVRLDWTPWAPHAALYAAEHQGYFKEEGLRVKLYVPPDPEATIRLVAGGQDDFGISYMTDTILAREQGIMITSVGALVPHPLNCIMTLKSSGIDTPQKLKGKIIGTTGVASDQAFLNWILKQSHLRESDVRLVNVGFDLAPALKSRKVDAIIGAYWPWEGIRLQLDGQPVNVMKLQEYGVPDYYELILITRNGLLSKDPAMVRAFLRALVKGQQFVQSHPDEAIQILAEADPDLSRGFLATSLQAMAPVMQFPSGAFHQDGKVWAQTTRFMRASGLINSSPAVDTVFSNDYLH